VDFDNVVMTMIETRMDHSDRVSYGAKWWQSGERKSVKLKQSIQIWVSKGLQIKPIPRDQEDIEVHVGGDKNRACRRAGCGVHTGMTGVRDECARLKEQGRV